MGDWKMPDGKAPGAKAALPAGVAKLLAGANSMPHTAPRAAKDRDLSVEFHIMFTFAYSCLPHSRKRVGERL
ncbi:MAG: hypothetical protein AAGF81_23140 [Pseudomonadota bacterium]